MEENQTPQNIEQYHEHYSESKLFEKIKKVCMNAGIKVIYYVLLLYYILTDENTPWEHKSIIIGALGYFILPIDLIPDFIPVAGYTDDVAALLACLRTVQANITPSIKNKVMKKLTDWFSIVDYGELRNYDNEI